MIVDYSAIGRVFGETMADQMYEVDERESDGASTLVTFAMAIEGMDPDHRATVLGLLTPRLEAVLAQRLDS